MAKKLPQYPLPINNAIANNVLHLLKDDSCDSTKLAHIIKQDPILGLKLFHCTETKLKEKRSDIQYIVHLIGLLVLHKITKAKKRTKHQAGFQEILSASLFATHLASSLLNKKIMLLAIASSCPPYYLTHLYG